MGEIYRAKRTTSNYQNLELALNNLKNIFLQNEYPASLIDEKMKLIKSRNFKPLKSKEQKKLDAIGNFDKTFNLSLPYKSSRCEKLSYSLVKKIREITPNFQLNLC